MRNKFGARAPQDVYALIYPEAQEVPRFILRALPTLCLEQLTSVFDAELIDDDVFSSILKVLFRLRRLFSSVSALRERESQATWGTELGAKAIASREQKRRAEYVLPFRDRVDSKKPKKS